MGSFCAPGLAHHGAGRSRTRCGERGLTEVHPARYQRFVQGGQWGHCLANLLRAERGNLGVHVWPHHK